MALFTVLQEFCLTSNRYANSAFQDIPFYFDCFIKLFIDKDIYLLFDKFKKRTKS